jgi:Anti-sigma-K factor rskA
MAPINHDEISRLLAVYSLDALPPDEVPEVEDHLADCARCQAELASLRDVAGLLGNSGAVSPEGMWDRIAREIRAQTTTATSPASAGPATSAPAPGRQDLTALPAQAGRTAGRPRRQLVWRAAAFGLVAAFLTVVAVLSFRVVNLDNRVNQLQSALAQHGAGQLVALALADPAHRTLELGTKGSSLHAEIVFLPDGRAYWVDDNLGGLPAGHTYQLWALSSGKVVSLGVLGRTPHNVAFVVEAPMTELMVTAEPAGGVPAPTTPVLLAGPLSL